MTRYAFWFFLALISCVGFYGIYMVKHYNEALAPVADAPLPVEEMLKTPEAQVALPASTGHARFVELVHPVDFLNTEPITIGQFVGKKVIMVTFITYTCINCQNTFAFLRKMQDTYGSKGLQIIAIHTPEFSYEKLKSNVQPALDAAGLTFPIVLDNDYETWRAYDNHYWPARYLIDLNGDIVFTHAGEGAYKETEARIVSSLSERSKILGLE